MDFIEATCDDCGKLIQEGDFCYQLVGGYWNVEGFVEAPADEFDKSILCRDCG